MSDVKTPIEPAGAGELGPEAMSTDKVESILADFRAWLREAQENPACPPPASAGGSPEFDVATVLQHFIALRQEVNLQTKAARAQQDQSAQTIALLQEAMVALERVPPEDDADVLRPLLKTLIDVHDALALAEREMRRLMNPSNSLTPGPFPGGRREEGRLPPRIKLKIPHWARWIGLDASIEAQLAPLYSWCEAHAGQAPSDRTTPALDAMLTGYRMGLQRLERAMTQHGLEVIECANQPFDPETMEVAEVVREPGRTSTEVLEVIRRGYTWRGRLFRFAQVRVAKP